MWLGLALIFVPTDSVWDCCCLVFGERLRRDCRHRSGREVHLRKAFVDTVVPCDDLFSLTQNDLQDLAENAGRSGW
ncbi:hypothetical protein CC86DRAFT_97784 [Ophiobolus disseminans]|uniref:Secreted protein n=1 Tax=Ophiobolus disseminans TaxID=1469910 RepID=A0A6A6ZMF9_9PLEO|nr:hypothetical protein CC86DRAFT_97784 [Ophiobolus disseminans]